MDTSGTNFHRSNLLGTLAYFGSPAVALRSQANATSLDATSLYSRAVVPLDTGTTANTDNTAVSASSALGGTNLAANDTNLGGTSSGLESTGGNTIITAHGSATPTGTATGTETTGGTVNDHQVAPTGPSLHDTGVSVSGDPHFVNDNTMWTQTGTPGDCYLVMAGNGVFLSALYGQAGGWHYCTMQDAQLTIPANPAGGIPNEITVNYAIYDPNQIQVTTVGANGQATTQNYNANNFGTNGTMTFGTGDSAVSVNLSGGVCTINTETPNGQQGSITIDANGQTNLEISCQGTFDNAGGIMGYVAQGNNINIDQNTLNNYAENNFNLTALGGADSAFIVNPNGMPGFQQWAAQNSNWNTAWTQNQINQQ